MLDFGTIGNELTISELLPTTDFSLDVILPVEVEIGIQGDIGWFLAPATFKIDHAVMPLPPGFHIDDLKSLIALVHSWMTTWIKNGSNTFIHPKLYRQKLPLCLQTAFITYSAYLNRTTATTGLILGAVNDEANALVSTLAQVTNDENEILEQLARVHALLAYQMIGLYDGDIRSRYLAEKRISIVHEAIDFVFQEGARILQDLTGFNINHVGLDLTGRTSAFESSWQPWIISESLRRTWLVGKCILAAYDGLKQEWTPCPGDVMFTTREGLWGANSAAAWSKICAEQDIRFVKRFDGEWLLGMPPEETDEFGKAMLETCWGRQRIKSWCGSDSGSVLEAG